MSSIPDEYQPNPFFPPQESSADDSLYSTIFDQSNNFDDYFNGNVEQEATNSPVHSVNTKVPNEEIRDDINHTPDRHRVTKFSTLINALDESLAYVTCVDASQSPPYSTPDFTDQSIYSQPSPHITNNSLSPALPVIIGFDHTPSPSNIRLLNYSEYSDWQTIGNVEVLNARNHPDPSLPFLSQHKNFQGRDIPLQTEVVTGIYRSSRQSLNPCASGVIEAINMTVTTPSGGQTGSRLMTSKQRTIKGKHRRKNSQADTSELRAPPLVTGQHMEKSAKAQKYRDETGGAFSRFQAALPENLRQGNQIQVLDRASEYLFTLETSVIHMKRAIKEQEALQTQLRTSIANLHGTTR